MLPYASDQLERTVTVPAGMVALDGTLGVPADAQGIVLFAHGSGTSVRAIGMSLELFATPGSPRSSWICFRRARRR